MNYSKEKGAVRTGANFKTFTLAEDLKQPQLIAASGPKSITAILHFDTSLRLIGVYPQADTAELAEAITTLVGSAFAGMGVAR